MPAESLAVNGRSGATADEESPVVVLDSGGNVVAHLLVTASMVAWILGSTGSVSISGCGGAVTVVGGGVLWAE